MGLQGPIHVVFNAKPPRCILHRCRDGILSRKHVEVKCGKSLERNGWRGFSPLERLASLLNLGHGRRGNQERKGCENEEIFHLADFDSSNLAHWRTKTLYLSMKSPIL